ncbi:MAG: FAD-dependent oxidoreductase [Ktedonobacteraceae bacterium]|nr:FAD-dependent oxidoreductase [Ktedonobacteraceae bacterium]
MKRNVGQDQTTRATERAQSTASTVPHVIIVGGGFGGLQTANALGKQALQITVIDQNNFHLFQPMLYQVATAGLSPSDIVTPLRALLDKQQNTDILMATVTDIDTQGQQVIMGDHQALHYDSLILATGATSNDFGHPEWARLAPGMKTLDEALTVRRRILSAFEIANRTPDPERRKALLTFVFVGGGPTGVELAGAVAELAHDTLKGNFKHMKHALCSFRVFQTFSCAFSYRPPKRPARDSSKWEWMSSRESISNISGREVSSLERNRWKPRTSSGQRECALRRPGSGSGPMSITPDGSRCRAT